MSVETPSAALADLPTIDQVIPVGPHDEECIEELRQVLVRHGALQRFGITLLHKHFDVGDEEVLLESVDADNRTLTQTPTSRGVSHGRAIETAWRLDDPLAQRRCEIICVPDRDREGKPVHSRNHYQTG